MGKKLNKIIYKTKDLGALLLHEGLESIVYWLYLLTPPISPKIFSSSPLEEYYSYANINQNFYRLYKKGYIHKIGKRRNIRFIFDQKLRYKFLDDYLARRVEKYRKGWDKKWRLLIYDIPDRRRIYREYLRNFLKDLGFGKVQASCWVSCYDFSSEIHHFCKEKRLIDYICIYEGTFFAGKSVDGLTEEIWGLNEFYSAYKNITAKVKEYMRIIQTEETLFKDYYRKYCNLFVKYKHLMLADPFLPKEFSSIWKIREDAEQKLLNLLKLLLGDAQLKFPKEIRV